MIAVDAKRGDNLRYSSKRKMGSPWSIAPMPCTTCIAAMIGVALLFFGFLFSQSLSPSGNIVETEKTVDFSLFGEPHQHDVPARLRKKMVAMLTADVKDADAAAGLLHPAAERSSTKDPMTLDEVTSYLEKFLHELHRVFVERKHSNIWQIWESYEQLVEKTLYKWDQEYLQRMPPRREDGSIFLSLASYRDENCLNTITWAYEKSRNPEKLFVGLVQQNCDAGCHSGLLEDGKMIPAEPDEDCHKVFCESDLGRPHCEAGRVRALHVNETESLGPYAARYFGSKLWYGESWYMQIDAHMTFAQDWDASSLEMLHTAPSRKPIISHYPPPHTVNFTEAKEKAAARLCGPVFASSVLESQIIRLEGLAFYDRTLQKVPKFAPFAAAGYFVAHSDALREVPFDPFLPWIFMGEEIIMSARLWTHGYDIFSPTIAVLGHMYARKHKPKFWESVHRIFEYGIHTPLQMLVLDRVKYQIKYPESARDMIKPKSLLNHVEDYGMGKVRTVEKFLDFVGLDMTAKEDYQDFNHWCKSGKIPPGFEKYKHLYTDERRHWSWD